jgi:hypothetical protein
VSSPGFLENYFRRLQGVGPALPIKTLVVENKVFKLERTPIVSPARPLGPPWRIAWPGAIRCRKSLSVLASLTKRRPDLISVSIFGSPSQAELPDFDDQIGGAANIYFGGPYTSGDLARIYESAHFGWAIDYMQEGMNSSWLLPNRLYEGSAHGAIPIALAQVETGKYLEKRGFGVRLSTLDELELFFDTLTNRRYSELRGELNRQPAEQFVTTRQECCELVSALQQ